MDMSHTRSTTRNSTCTRTDPTHKSLSFDSKYRSHFVCRHKEDFMASEEEAPMRDSSDDTKAMKETARRLVPSEAVREFSSRDQVLSGNRISSSLTLVTTECFSKLDSPPSAQKASHVESVDELPKTLQKSIDVDDELPQQLRVLLDSTSRMSQMLQLLDERICRIEQGSEALNESNRGNIGLNIQQASSGTAVGTPQETEPFIDDQLVDPQDTDVKAGESNTKEQVGLNPDSFSFLISARPLSIPFVTGLLAFALKNAIFYLVMINLIDLQGPFNKLGIPVTVSTAVLINQVLAFGISVFTQNDLVTGLVLLYHGYSQDVSDVYGQRDGMTGGGGRFEQWLFAVFCLFGDALDGLGHQLIGRSRSQSL